MSKSFFVAWNGRSWTVWLSSLLNQSDNYIVKHEDWDHHHVRDPMYFEDFPVDRFVEWYGECSGMLLRYMAPWYDNGILSIPHRFVLLRKKKDLVKSWMNKGNKTVDDFWWVCCQIATRERLLLDYCHRDTWCTILLFEEITRNTNVLQKMCDDIGISLEITNDMITNKKNSTKDVWFDRNEKRDAKYEHIMNRFRHPQGI